MGHLTQCRPYADGSKVYIPRHFHFQSRDGSLATAIAYESRRSQIYHDFGPRQIVEYATTGRMQRFQLNKEVGLDLMRHDVNRESHTAPRWIGTVVRLERVCFYF